MIRSGRFKIEALIDLPGAGPAIEADCVANSKDKAKLLPAGYITLPCASASACVAAGSL